MITLISSYQFSHVSVKIWLGKTRKYMYKNTKNIYSSKKVTHNILVYGQVQVIVAVTSVLCISYVFEYIE